MKYLTDATDLQMMCMLLQYKKGRIGKINYDTIPYIAALPDFEYISYTLPTVVELDLYYESLSSQVLCVTVSDISKLKLVIDNGTIYTTSEAGIIRFTPVHTGLSTIRLYTTDNSKITLGRSTTSGSTTTYYSVTNLEYKTSKAGTNASLIAVRISGNVDFSNRAFFNCTQLKTVAIFSSANATRSSSVIDGCTALETLLDSSPYPWSGFKNYVLPNKSTPPHNCLKAICLYPDTVNNLTVTNPNIQKCTLVGSYSGVISVYFYDCTNLHDLYLIFPYITGIYTPNMSLSWTDATPINKLIIDCRFLVSLQGNQDISNVDVYVPAELINKYKADAYWSTAKSINALELG